MTYPLAKPADGYVKLIHGSVDIKVIDAVFDPTHRISAHPEPLEHVGGQGYRVDPVGGDVRHLAGDPVGMGVDPWGIRWSRQLLSRRTERNCQFAKSWFS